MHEIERRYLLACCLSSACAVLIAALSWRYSPPGHAHWISVLCFAIYAGLAELMAVVTDEGRGVTVSPTSPILWAATCVLGPSLAIVVCVAYYLLALTASGWCHGITIRYGLRSSEESAGARRSGLLIKLLRKWIVSVGDPWRSKGFLRVVQYVTFCISSAIIVVGPAGFAYHAVGGHFLGVGHLVHPAREFVLPFLVLVVVSVFAEHAIYTGFIVSMNPASPGRGSLYATLLRAKLVFLEDVLPVWKGQLFLVAVAMLISYLYIHIGVWGFVLTAMPVFALRDFFRQWIDERVAYVDTITTLATYMQHYHPYTRGHLKRVADLSLRLARELRLPVESIRHIGTAGFLHDIGKIAVSEEVLDKTSKLSDDEWDQIREHPVKGAEIISHIEFLEGIADWIRYHHKWYNGAGYPVTNDGTVEIPIEAAIIATADAFDAMTDDRELSVNWQCDSCGYHPDDRSRPVRCPLCGSEKRRTFGVPRSFDDAIDELRRGAGSQFHPRVVKAFLRMVERDGIKLDE